MNDRTAQIERRTGETTISGRINLDGTGAADITTGLGFLNHMLTAFALHSRIDLDLRCAGDLDVDDHHTVEDCALAIGAAIDIALGDGRGIGRFGSAYAPLDESLARVVIDLSGRACAVVNLDLRRPTIGDVACENLDHFFRSLATSMRAAMHVDVLRGDNDHHKAEAACKACALALRAAIARTTAGDAVISTKGALR